VLKSNPEELTLENAPRCGCTTASTGSRACRLPSWTREFYRSLVLAAEFDYLPAMKRFMSLRQPLRTGTACGHLYD
jgi:hypothetical protein